jgi:hypothetical protein
MVSRKLHPPVALIQTVSSCCPWDRGLGGTCSRCDWGGKVFQSAASHLLTQLSRLVHRANWSSQILHEGIYTYGPEREHAPRGAVTRSPTVTTYSKLRDVLHHLAHLHTHWFLKLWVAIPVLQHHSLKAYRGAEICALLISEIVGGESSASSSGRFIMCKLGRRLGVIVKSAWT